MILICCRLRLIRWLRKEMPTHSSQVEMETLNHSKEVMEAHQQQALEARETVLSAAAYPTIISPCMSERVSHNP